MRPIRTSLREGLLISTVALMVLIGLPLMAILVLVFRPVLIVVLGAALVVGGIAYALSPAFRDWWVAKTTEPGACSGLRLPTDVALHPGHGWARRISRDFVVGADDLAQAVLGPVDRVDSPRAGQRIHRGEPLFRLRHGERSVDVVSPVSGAVTEVNADLQGRPGLVNEDPFDRGWVVRLHADDVNEDRQALRRGEAARAWLRAEVDRLVATLVDDQEVAAAADGGTLVDDLHRHIDDETWVRLTRSFFYPNSATARRTGEAAHSNG